MSGRLVGYGLWWPWGDEITVSLRIGLGGDVLERLPAPPADDQGLPPMRLAHSVKCAGSGL